ncbi:ferroxidase fet3 [Thoreauomyces humboldtii]|nr:ferroxidase fet3 [Thoreauomyces humboldtii]
MKVLAFAAAVLATVSSVAAQAVVARNTSSVAPLLPVPVYDFEVTYVANVNPDGVFPRRVIGINGVWPPPPIYANYNETLTVNVVNALDVPTSMHMHGLYFRNQSYLDGASGVTQCGIPPGATFTHSFVPLQWGTYWYHAHHGGQYVDGFRGPLIIRPPKEIYSYDAEYIVIMHDVYHAEFEQIMKSYAGEWNPTGSEPPPDGAIFLIHDGTNYVPTMKFTPGKTYRLRMINMSAFSMFNVAITGHSMDVIEVDGEDVERSTTTGLSVSVAQRWSVLVEAKNDTSLNYQMQFITESSMFAIIPTTLNLSFNATVEYAPGAPYNSTTADFVEVDDTTLVPIVPIPSSPVTQTVQLDILLAQLDDGTNHGMFNNIPYLAPKVPTIFTAMTAGNNSNDVSIYATHSNPSVLGYNNVVEVIINNYDAGSHPFHLHGHKFQIMGRNENTTYDPTQPFPEQANPIRRDVIQIPAGGSVAIRFTADNPGVWLFHCHIQWHMETGLAATFIEAPAEMQQQTVIPQFMRDQCAALGTPADGNAMGRTGVDILDMSGQPTGPSPITGEWTSKGKGALAATIIAALLGLGTVIWFASVDAES